MALQNPSQLQLLKKRKQNKYRNDKVPYDGVMFDSKKELECWKWLLMLQKNGTIKKLERQKSFPLVVDGKKICRYVADFYFFDSEHGWTVIDTKGFRTQVYKLKKALFGVLYPKILFREQ